jgi:hypothetical protein
LCDIQNCRIIWIVPIEHQFYWLICYVVAVSTTAICWFYSVWSVWCNFTKQPRVLYFSDVIFITKSIYKVLFHFSTFLFALSYFLKLWWKKTYPLRILTTTDWNDDNEEQQGVIQKRQDEGILKKAWQMIIIKKQKLLVHRKVIILIEVKRQITTIMTNDR